MTAIATAAPAPRTLTFLATFAKLELRRIFRNRRYVLFGMGFPVLFYLLYTGVLQRGQPVGSIDGVPWTSYFMVSMAAYGAMIAGLFSAQVIATERSQGWVRLLRVTPLPPAVYVGTKLLVSLVVTLPAVLLVTVAGIVVNHVNVPPVDLAALILALVLGSLPFAALGILLGYLFDVNSAQGAVMITNFGLAILGGLWAPTQAFPDALVTIAKVLPSYHFANLGRAIVAARTPDVVDIAVLVGYAVVIGGLVFWRYRSEEQRARA
jgi:ABC-2 type transport system permease protein